MSSASEEKEVSPGIAGGAVINSETHKSGGGGGGGLFDYLISRKKIHSTPPSSSSSPSDKQRKREERMKNYHRMANAAGSQYFGSLAALPLFHDDSDSDHDDTTTNKNNAAKFAAASSSSSLSVPSLISSNAAADVDDQSSPSKSKFWLAKFQKQEKQLPLQNIDVDELNTDTTISIVEHSSSSSWMNKAWQTVDSATDWMSSPSPSTKLPSNKNNSAQQQPSSSSASSWWAVPSSSTLSNAISSIVVNIPNPFKDDNESIIKKSNNSSLVDYNGNHSSNKNNNNGSAHLLPKIASRFEWATKRRNPYSQAVIGRVDTDYYLLSGVILGGYYGGGRGRSGGGSIGNLWGLISLRWLPTVGGGRRKVLADTEQDGNGRTSNGGGENGDNKVRVRDHSLLFFSLRIHVRLFISFWYQTSTEWAFMRQGCFQLTHLIGMIAAVGPFHCSACLHPRFL